MPGTVVIGMGIALEEESMIDRTFGRFITPNLEDLHVPVNADVYDIEVIFVPVYFLNTATRYAFVSSLLILLLSNKIENLLFLNLKFSGIPSRRHKILLY